MVVVSEDENVSHLAYLVVDWVVEGVGAVLPG
jgi:hypothetical protein